MSRDRHWRETWEALELPPPAAPDAGFTARVVARARAGRGRGPGGAPLPAWARAAALAALLAGAVGGYRLGAAEPGAIASGTGEESLLAWGGATLAEEYVGLVAADAASGVAR